MNLVQYDVLARIGAPVDLPLAPLVETQACEVLRFEGELVDAGGFVFQPVRLGAAANTGFNVVRFEVDGWNQLTQAVPIDIVANLSMDLYIPSGRRFALEVERVNGAMAFVLHGFVRDVR